MSKHPNPPAMPLGAVGFVAQRHDKPGRLALYRPDGTLSNTYGRNETLMQVGNALAAAGYKSLQPHREYTLFVFPEGYAR